jgi:hypothetical protein
MSQSTWAVLIAIAIVLYLVDKDQAHASSSG